MEKRRMGGGRNQLKGYGVAGRGRRLPDDLGGAIGHDVHSTNRGAERRAPRCCSCPSSGAAARRPSTRQLEAATFFVASSMGKRVAIQVFASPIASCTQRGIVPDEDVQHCRNERAEHRRPLVLADASEPADRHVFEYVTRRPWCRLDVTTDGSRAPGGSSSIPACRCQGSATPLSARIRSRLRRSDSCHAYRHLNAAKRDRCQVRLRRRLCRATAAFPAVSAPATVVRFSGVQ